MSIEPRDGATLDYVQLWDIGCVRTRLNQVTQEIMSKLEHNFRENIRAKHFKEQIKRGKPLPLPKQPVFSQGEKVERFGGKARKMAEDILEKERQNYVDFRSGRDKPMIIEITRKLRFLVWTVDEEGEPTKLKIIIEKGWIGDHKGGGHVGDIQYVGDHDFERLHRINSLMNRLGQLRPYFPYYSAEIKMLYKEAVDVGRLEVVQKKRVEKAKT